MERFFELWLGLAKLHENDQRRTVEEVLAIYRQLAIG